MGRLPLRRLLRQRRSALPPGPGDALSHLQEIPRLPQLHGLDHRGATPEVGSDDSCLVGTLFAGSRPVRRRPCQRLAGEAGQALRVFGLEAAVGDQTPRLQDKDLYHTRLRRRGDDGLHSLGAYHGPGQPHPLYAGDEIPEPGRRFELEPRRQPLPLRDERPEVLFPALTAQQCDDLVHDFAAVLLLAHAQARRAAAHLAVEAGLAITRAPLEGEDPTQRLHAGVQNPCAPEGTEVDETGVGHVFGDPLWNGIGFVGVEPDVPARPVLPAGRVEAREQALYLPRLEDEGVELALRLLDAHLGDLLHEAPDLAAPVSAVEVGSDTRLEVFGFAHVERGAVLVHKVVDAWRVRQPAREVLLLRLDAAPPTPQGSGLPDAAHARGAEKLQQLFEHLGGRRGVGERPVVRRLAHAEVGDERAETVSPEPGHQAPG